VGAALAAGISLAVSVSFWAAAATDLFRGFVGREVLVLVSVGAAIGVPVGAVLGWITVRELLSTRAARPWLLVPLATWAVLLGAPLVAIALAFQTTARPEGDLWTLAGLVGLLARSAGEVIAAAVMALPFGMILFGLPAWVLAAAVAALWVPAIGAVLGNAPLPVAKPAPEGSAPEAVSRSDPVGPRLLGWVAVGAILAIALALTCLRARSDVPPGMLAGALLGFLAAFAGPGLVAALGLARRRPDLILAAAIALVCLAPLSMGGATVPELVPAVVLFYVALRMPATRLHDARRAATAVVTIGLLAAPIALFTTTEIVCWDDYGAGSVVVWVVPEMPNQQSSVAPFGSGCSSGSISALGGSLAILAVAGAVGTATRSGSRKPASSRGPMPGSAAAHQPSTDADEDQPEGGA
jgi:hypothetical protein